MPPRCVALCATCCRAGRAGRHWLLHAGVLRVVIATGWSYSAGDNGARTDVTARGESGLRLTAVGAVRVGVAAGVFGEFVDLLSGFTEATDSFGEAGVGQFGERIVSLWLAETALVGDFCRRQRPAVVEDHACEFRGTGQTLWLAHYISPYRRWLKNPSQSGEEGGRRGTLTPRGTDAPAMTDVAVLRKGTHGLGTEAYAAALRDRLGDTTVSLARTPSEERELVAEASVVTGSGIDEDLLAAAGDLELFACAYAGYGHLPMDALRERGVAVTNAAGIHAPSIAEQVLGYLLTFARNLHEGWRRQRNREYRHYQGRELGGSTVTIVGMGAIGHAVVDRLQGFDVDTIGVRYTPGKGGPTDDIVGVEDSPAVHDALARTDYLVLATPLTETTRGLVDEAAFDTLPPESVLVNVARGGVVDTDALVHAVRKQSIRGAALDVTDPEPLPEDHPLWNFENVLLTPHNAGHTPEHWNRLADILAANVPKLDSGEELRNRVD